MPTTSFDKDSIKASIIGKLQRYNGRTIEEASNGQIYRALASTVRDQIMQKWMISREERKTNNNKRLFYLSVEFLMGRSLYTNILNLVSLDAYKQALDELHIDVDKVLQEEPEPALGNGGLGRLAACFMDSLASLDLPAMGCSIRYEYGLFRQKIVDGQQVELPDYWLGNGNVWEMPVMEDACEVHFNGHVEMGNENGRTVFRHVGYNTVEAVPYDMPLVGYDTSTVNSLRLWSARAPKRIDLSDFNHGHYVQASEEKELAEAISNILYPEDNHYEGKLLRLKQQYFFTSATLQYILKDFKKLNGTNWSKLPEKVVIHINDTHPGLAIPELMRLLMDEEGLGWDEAQQIVSRTMAYTNHTIMAEALEKWPEDMVKSLLPRIYQIQASLRAPVELLPRRGGARGPHGDYCLRLHPHGEPVRCHDVLHQRREQAARRYPQAGDVPRLLPRYAGEVQRNYQRHHASPLADGVQPGTDQAYLRHHRHGLGERSGTAA